MKNSAKTTRVSPEKCTPEMISKINSRGSQGEKPEMNFVHDCFDQLVQSTIPVYLAFKDTLDNWYKYTIRLG